MAMKMNDFLLEFYKRLIFRDMPVEQFAQFCDYVKADDFTGDMKKWKDLLEKDPADPSGKTFLSDPITKLYKRKASLDVTDLEPDDIDKLYKAFQNAFRSMDAARSSFKDKDKATKFLDKYFGAGRLFSHATANPRAENLIQNDLKNFLETNKDNLKFVFKKWGVINDDFSYKDLMDGIDSHKYNKNSDFQHRLDTIIEYLVYYKDDQEFLAKDLKLRPGQQMPDFSDIKNGFNDDVIDAPHRDLFKSEFVDILRELYTTSDAYDVFKDHDSGKISKHFDKAKAFLDYNTPGEKNYVKPKREDQLTIAQRLSDFVSDNYKDTIEKYIKFSGDRLFFSDAAKAIVGGLDNAKVRPTDGLAGAKKAMGGIVEDLNAAGKFTAAKHAKWFAGALNEFSDDKNMSHIFDGALKNSTQMKALIRELIFKAVRENKIDEAKTAMEVLSVIKYGITTSKIMDAINKTDVSLFSDGKLSWNKNEGVAFVTAAMDKSLKFAIKGLGYGLTIVGNSIKQSGSKIHKTTGALNKERKKRLASDAAAKQDLDTKIGEERQMKTTLEAQVSTHTAAGRTEASLNSDMTLAEQERNLARRDIETALQQVVAWIQNHDDTNPDYAAVYRYYQTVVDALDSRSGGTWAPVALPAHLTAPGGGLFGVEMQINHDVAVFQAKTDEYSTANDYLNDLTNARTSLDAISQRLTAHLDESRDWDANHHDKTEELINYWNMLEQGRDSHMGPMYSWFGRKKTAEKKFKNIRGNLIQNAMTNKIAMDK